MKYFSLNTLILIGLSVFLTGCYHDYDYDLTRSHDIYRMNYKYNPSTPAPSAPAPGAPGDTTGAPPSDTTTGAEAPSTAPQQPAVPAAR